MMLSTLDAAPWHDKSSTENGCCILFMMCWHKFQMIFNSCFISVGRLQLLCRGTSGVDVVLLTYREEPKQTRHPIAGLPLLEFSSTGKLIRYLHGSYFLPYRFVDVFLFYFLSAIHLPSVASAPCRSSVHWMLFSPYHEIFERMDKTHLSMLKALEKLYLSVRFQHFFLSRHC